MCYVNATELKENLSFYLKKAETEDVYVTKNGRTICCIVNSQYKALIDTINLVESLDLPTSISDNDKDIIGEEIMRKHGK